MQIKFLNAKNFKTFSLVAAIVLIVFQLVKSISTIGTLISAIAINIGNIEWLGARAVVYVLQNIVGLIPPVVALAGAVALGLAVILKKKNKLAFMGAGALMAAELITLISSAVFGLISVFFSGSAAGIIGGIIGWVIGLISPVLFVVAYALFLAIICKGIAPESKITALLDKVPEKFRSYLLYIPGALLIVGGIVAVIATVITTVVTAMTWGGAGAIGGAIGTAITSALGGIGTVILYAIKGFILAIIGAWANDAVAEEAPIVVEEVPVVEEAPAEETPAE